MTQKRSSSGRPRVAASVLELIGGTPLVKLNRIPKPEGATVLAAEAVARSSPDGYTLFMATVANTLNPAQTNSGFNLGRDMAPVALLGGDKTRLDNLWYPPNVNEAEHRLDHDGCDDEARGDLHRGPDVGIAQDVRIMLGAEPADRRARRQQSRSA